jgi:homoserine kinase
MTTIRVRVPASTSNLGGGFDCVGIAIDRWLQLDARLDSDNAESVRLVRSGTLSAIGCAPTDDLLYRGFALACEAARRDVPRGLVLDAESDIPVGRGLGSSAAALLAGAAAANALLGLDLPASALAQLCAEVEGHGDNVGPCFLGGAVFATLGTPQGLILAPIAMHPSLRLVFVVPDFPVSTHLARAALPASLPHADARFAAAASAALVLGLERGDHTLLAVGLEGPLHIPYRRALVQGYDRVVDASRGAGAIGATLSGSGSAIVALAESPRAEAVAAAMTSAWRASGVEAASFISPPCPDGLQLQRVSNQEGAASDAPAEHPRASHISSTTR